MNSAIQKNITSICFLVMIGLSFFASLFLIYTFFLLFQIYSFDTSKWALFVAGFIGATSILSSSNVAYIRTFIHELKHAVLIVFTGNKLKGMKVGAYEGHVEYLVYHNKVRFVPFILLAPYCFPLFSFLPLCAFLIFETASSKLIILLSITLAADITLGFQEWHDKQTDITSLLGGKYIAILYVLGIQLLWFTFCMLVVLAGTNGVVYFSLLLVEKLLMLTQYF